MLYDVALIGSGISAGPVLERLALAGRGLKIIVIERGPMPWPDVTWQTANTEKKAPRWWTSCKPGGAATLWYGQVSRFSEADFHVPSPWPVPPNVWGKNYDAVARLLRPYCADHLLRGTAPLDNQHCTPRSMLASFERFMFDHLEANGVNAYSGQTCLGGHGWSARPVDPVSLADLSLTVSHGHNRNWLWRIDQLCRTNSGIERVRGVWVKAVRPHERGYGYEVLGQTATGQGWLTSARKVVVAAGVAETIPILSTLPDVGNALGTGFTLTTEHTAYLQTELRRKDTHDLKIGSFAHVSARFPFVQNKTKIDLSGKLSFYDALAFETPDRLQRKLRSFGAPAADLSPDGCLVLKISFKGQSQPSTGKRIVPDQNQRIRLRYTPTDTDRTLISMVKVAIQQIADRLPGARFLGVSDNIFEDDHSSAHFHGGAPMGSDPDTSVLDPDCRVWQHPGVLVADASFMPGSGSTNSSLTVMANAWRVAGKLLRDL